MWQGEVFVNVYAHEGCRQEITSSKEGEFFPTAMLCFLNFSKFLEEFLSKIPVFSMCRNQSIQYKCIGFIYY